MIRHLYIHIPFCHKICPYCAFYKHQPGPTRFGDFVDALLAELDFHITQWTIIPRTVYFGGGTPSLLPAEDFVRLSKGLRERLDLSELCEWSVEVNPKTVDLKKAEAMRAQGVTRVSLGVQSWQPKFLEILGRDHTPEDAANSYRVLQSVGFQVLNIDLMFSLPGLSLEEWTADLERTVALKPKHISAYNLNYEEDTEFFAKLGQGAYVDNEEQNAAHFEAADALLTKHGYRHYEISNYAQFVSESMHNEAYWVGADYIGLGPSAVSTVEGNRWKNLPNTGLYTELARANPSALQTEKERLNARDWMNERVALLLRTDQGIPITYIDPRVLPRARNLCEEGLLEEEGVFMRLTHASRALVDSVAAELFLAKETEAPPQTTEPPLS